MNHETKAAREATDAGALKPAESPASRGARSFRSVEIFADAQEVIIEHGGELYRLRATRKGKLILTK